MSEENIDYAAIEKDTDSKDPAVVDAAFRKLGGVPLPSGAEAILMKIANKAGHPRRYEAMILLNALMRNKPLFESALTDNDPQIRTAAYSSLAMHRKPDYFARLIKGLDDPSPEVQDHVMELILGSLQGSDIDQRAPLVQEPAYQTLCSEIQTRFAQLAKNGDGKLKEDAKYGLELFEMFKKK